MLARFCSQANASSTDNASGAGSRQCSRWSECALPEGCCGGGEGGNKETIDVTCHHHKFGGCFEAVDDKGFRVALDHTWSCV